MELHAQISCAMPRELARKGVGWQDRAVYTEAIYYGRENLTDGVIARTSLAFWMPDMPVKERTRRLDALLAAGALVNHAEGWQFPEHVWRKWGKTRAEVEKKRAEEAERLRKHREKAKAAREAAEAAYEERTDVRDEYVHGAYETPKPQPYPEPQPEPYPYPSSSSPPSTQVGDNPASDDDRFLAEVLDAIATIRTELLADRNPKVYKSVTLTSLESERATIVEMLTELDYLRDGTPKDAAEWYEASSWKRRAS